MRTWSLAVLAVVLLQCAGGCGGSDKKAAASTSTTSAAGPIPAELLGTYTTKLSASDLPPNPPPELAESNGWTLKITKTGAVNNGPGFSIVSDQAGELETSPPSVSGDRITLNNEECGTTGSQVESVYGYKLQDGHLTFTAVKNGCPDKVALTILTAGAWTKKH